MIVEVRGYEIVPGELDEFVRLMREESVPLLEAAGIRVLACGASLTAEDGRRDAYLVRGFESAERLEEQESAFYASAAWRQGPREEILRRIVRYTSASFPAADLG